MFPPRFGIPNVNRAVRRADDVSTIRREEEMFALAGEAEPRAAQSRDDTRRQRLTFAIQPDRSPLGDGDGTSQEYG